MCSFFILFFLVIISCHTDVRDIAVQGIVSDRATEKPIKNAKVTVICWKYGKTADQSYTENETKVATTKKNGEYHVQFDKGAYIEVKVSYDGFVDGHEAKQALAKTSTINVLLKAE